MKKSLIFVGMLAIGYANAQEGNVGINTDQPKATLDIQPNATNLAGTTNQGILAPRLSKVRVANIETPVEGTLVYVTDETASPISAYTGTDTKVAKITEKGYYFYNGTEWVKTSATDGGEWKYDGVDAIVAKRANETTAQDLIQIKNGKGLQQFIGSPDASTLTYKGYNSVSGQVEDYPIFKTGADLKIVPNFKYITSDALSDTSIFEEKHRPNNRIFTSDYKLFQFKPSHLDKVTTNQITYVPYHKVAHFDNINNKGISDIWLNREQLYLSDKNIGTISNTGVYEGRTEISGSNSITNLRGIDSDIVLRGANQIVNMYGIRNLMSNTHGFSGEITGEVLGNTSSINFQTGGDVNRVRNFHSGFIVPSTSNASVKYINGYNTSIDYKSKNTKTVDRVVSYRAYINLDTAAPTSTVQGIDSYLSSNSEVKEGLTSAWFSNTYQNKNASSSELKRMDGVVVSNNYVASAPVKVYSGVIVHNKVSAEATGNIAVLNGMYINNEKVDGTTSQITNNYGIHIDDIKGATNANHAIHTGAGQIRFGDLKGTGDRVVYADSNGVLKTGSANITATNGLQNTENMECNATNRGKMNFIQGEDGKSDVFGICMKNKNGNYYWGYMVGGNNPTNGSGTFGSGL